MRKKANAVELENEILEKKAKTHRVRIFALGSIVGASFTLLNKNKFLTGKFKKILESAILKCKNKQEVE